MYVFSKSEVALDHTLSEREIPLCIYRSVGSVSLETVTNTKSYQRFVVVVFIF